MQNPAKIDLIGDRQAWLVRDLSFMGFDFTAADFFMQVRSAKDTTNTPLISLLKVTTAVQGVRLISAASSTITAHIAAGRLPSVPDAINPATGVKYVTTDTVWVSQLRIYVNLASMQGLPYPTERGKDAEFYYDLIVDPTVGTAAEDKQVYAYGSFIVRAGVTIP